MDMYHRHTDMKRCLPYSTSHPKHGFKSIPFVMTRPICTIVENDSLENNNNLTFTSTFNPNYPKIFDLIKSGVNTLVGNNVNGFKNIKLIHAKRQPPNLKRILTNSLFTNKTAAIFKCSDSRCLCCQQLLLEILYTFKNVGKQFFLKTKIICGSGNLIYLVICPTCKEEYIGKTGIGDSELRDRVRIYRHHIRQPEHEKVRVEKHLRTCGKGNFTIFPFYSCVQMTQIFNANMKITL